MKNDKNVIQVSREHITMGITKYKGVKDEHLMKLIRFAGLSYIPYVFEDGRVLLVLPGEIAAFLYKNKEALFHALSLGN